MRVRLGLSSLLSTIKQGYNTNEFRFLCMVAGVHEHQRVLDSLKSGDFELVARSD